MAKKRGNLPFGIGETKPHHYLEMFRIAAENSGKPAYAWRVLNDGVCDGCALGTSGLKDWTIDGTHLCLVRLNLLRLNTMGAMKRDALADVRGLPKYAKKGSSQSAIRAAKKAGKALRELGRLDTPLRWGRGEAGYSRISWDEALSELGGHLRHADPRRMALYMTSRGITNEVYFAAQKAWRAAGSPHIDNAARLCHSPSTAAMKATMGVAASTCSYRDWFSADVIVFFGSNPANDQPVALKYLYEAKKRHPKKRAPKVIVVNTYDEPGMRRYWIPSNADSAVLGTDIADRVVHVSAGGDLAFVQAVQKILIGRRAIDRAFVDAHTEGFLEYETALRDVSLEDLVTKSGASMSDIIAFADDLQGASTGVFVWSMGLTQHAHGTDTVAAVCQLGLSQGFVGREGCGMMPIRGHSGVQGGAEMGAYATVFPGRPISESSADELEELWGFRPPVQVGLDSAAMLDAALSDELDILYAIGGNFLDTLPDPDQVHDALANVPVRIHQDIFATTAMLVEPRDVAYILPAQTRYEHRGGVTETTTERRVIYSPYIPGHDVGESRAEWKIVTDLISAAWPELKDLVGYEDTQAIREDISRTIPAYEPIKDLRKKGDQFQRGGERTCEGGKFPTPSGKGHFKYAEAPDRSLPPGHFHMATRRGKQFNSIVQQEVDSLTGAARDHVFMSRRDMDSLGVHPDERIEVKNEHGAFLGRVFEAPITPGSVQLHWPEANVLIPGGRRDPGGLVPDYNAVVKIAAARS